MQRILRKLDDIPQGQLKPAHIRTATVVRLPFHLCTGAMFQFVDPEQDRIQIWLRNKLHASHESTVHEAWSEQVRNRESKSSPDDFLTDALVLDRHPELRSGEFDAIRAEKTGEIGFASVKSPGFRLLNELIAAHQMVRVGPYISGAGALWPQMLSEREIIERILVEVVLIAKVDRTIEQGHIARLFENLDELRLGIWSGGVGDLRDYSPEQLRMLEASVRRLRSHAFYELKTNAIAAMLRGDSIVAIVLACAALEGAHGAFIRESLRSKIPGGSGKFNEFMSTLLREHGFYSLVQLSVRVFLAAEERPTEDELKQCLKGVTIRNAIMHAAIKGTGKYKIREMSRSEIDDGYSGIMAVYRAFETAVQAREEL